MSIYLNFFKDYNITDRKIEYLDGDSAEYSAGHVSDINEHFDIFTGDTIPVWDNVNDLPELIPPATILEMCDVALENLDHGCYLFNTIQDLKYLASKGYYLTFSA